MYASRRTAVLYDVCILNPFQVAITVNCGHSYVSLLIIVHFRCNVICTKKLKLLHRRNIL